MDVTRNAMRGKIFFAVGVTFLRTWSLRLCEGTHLPSFEEKCFAFQGDSNWKQRKLKQICLSFTIIPILTIIILALYRAGDKGDFLGVGGTFDLYQDKTVDVEIMASGVIVGYLLYNLAVVISYGATKERLANDCLMNIIGIFLWLGVAGTALHYWHSYKDEWKIKDVGSERDAGLVMGSFCVFNGVLHIIDAAVALKLFLDQEGVMYRTPRSRKV